MSLLLVLRGFILTIPKTLMLLRRFPVLNDLPIRAIQAQALAKETIQRGIAQEMIARGNVELNGQGEGQNRARKDLLNTLRK
jgi:hypothetical protein